MTDVKPGSEILLPGQPRPNFLVAGVAKAGTTSLYEYLRQHPQIFMSENKEPCYFVHGYGVKKWEDYLALFKDAAGEKALGEASTAYCSCEESAAWIRAVLGEIKIIILLRNPAKRAFSEYVWMVREGYEDAPTFAEALAREPARLKDAAFQAKPPQLFEDFLYFHAGLYFEQVSRFFNTFGRERVRVYLFEEFVKEPLVICQDVFRFLDVDDSFVPKLERHNEGRIPQSIAWQHWLRAEPKRRRLLGSRSLRGKLAARLMEWNIQRGSKPQAEDKVLAALTERYRPDIEKLEALLGRDLSGWLKSKN